MKKIILYFVFNFLFLSAFTQNDNELYGVVRKNYYSTLYDPIDSNFTYEAFDSATVRLGKLNTNTGFVENIGEFSESMLVNLTGAALDPYSNSYLFFGGYTFITMDLNSGEINNEVQLFNPNGESYFDNFRFNNSDSSIYGLARRNYYDSNFNFTGAEMFLSRLNSVNGEITQISQNSTGSGFALAGSAIDPYQMVYYFSTGGAIVGLDMYEGDVYSSFPIDFNSGIMFDNFTYSCVDTSLYGLIRQNFYSTIIDSLNGGFETTILDSTSMKLGKINTSSGVLTEVSQSSIGFGGYSLNASSAIDPNSMTYYFSSGDNLVGVSMVTGQVTQLNPWEFEDGTYFDLMRNFNNCRLATKVRINTNSSKLKELNKTNNFNVYPNPVASEFTIQFQNLKSNSEIKILDQYGKTQKTIDNFSGKEINIQRGNLSSGIYFVQITDENGRTEINKISFID